MQYWTFERLVSLDNADVCVNACGCACVHVRAHVHISAHVQCVHLCMCPRTRERQRERERERERERRRIGRIHGCKPLLEDQKVKALQTCILADEQTHSLITREQT